MASQHLEIPYPRSYSLEDLPLKTLDTGNNGVHVSANAYGNILLINSTHRKYGIIVAISYEPFNGDFLNQDVVREYRRKLLGDDLLKNQSAGFGIFFECPGLEPAGVVALQHLSDTSLSTKAVRSEYRCRNGALITTTIAIMKNGEVRQARTIMNDTGNSIRVTSQLHIANASPHRVCVSRASYGQLTEGGIMPMPGSACETVAESSQFSVYNKGMEAVLEGHVESVSGPITQTDSYSTAQANQVYTIDQGNSRTFVVRFRLRQVDPRPAVESPPKMDLALLNKEWDKSLARTSISKLGSYKIDMAEYITWRNVDYVLDNCSIQVFAKKNQDVKTAENPVCVITDHVALPLGWNRDNYWQLVLLMKLRKAGSTLTGSLIWYAKKNDAYNASIDKVLFGHLNWVFRQARTHSTVKGESILLYKDVNGARRIDKTAVATKTRTGFWPRSFTINGTAKDGDGIFQLDQQCYPLLELCDFWDTYRMVKHQNSDARKLVTEILAEKQMERVLELLTGSFDKIGLIKTDETPGDDEAKYGYLFSCNLLVWHTFERLAELFTQFEQTPTILKEFDLSRKAEDLRRQSLQCFKTSVTTNGTKKQVFAYECGFTKSTPEQDLADASKLKHRVYGDGNDIPTLMTRHWNFVQEPADIATWQNTMDWMFDPVANRAPGNEKTYWVGKGPNDISGLGSVHSAKPWPLGIYQEWRYYTMRGTGFTEKAQDAWNRLEKVAQWDATFSETVDMETGECDSKAWFSWPGAMIASALIDEDIASRTLKK